MDNLQDALMQWGEAMHVAMENRTLSYSPVLRHWRVKKWTGKEARSFIYEHLLGPHAADNPHKAVDRDGVA
jgi:hypothetical protein